jgi:2,3-bisphosphoglycerate-dependent phosphoglycerate mutase
MPRTIAALIRHGDYQQLPNTPSALQPFPLTALGCRQAESAALTLNSMLRQHHWSLATTIDSSQLLRAWQTADIISKQLHHGALLVESFDALAERSMGSAANLSIGQIESILEQDPRYPSPPPNWKARSDYQLPLQGAESLVQAGQRVAEHLRAQMLALQAKSTQDTLKLFVGHGASFRHAAWQLGVLAFEQIAELSMYHGSPVLLEYCDDGSWSHIAGDWKQRKSSEEITD